MNFDGVRNAKAEVFADAFRFQEILSVQGADNTGPTFGPMSGTEVYEDIAAARRQRKVDPREMIAVGVLRPDGHNANPDELQLGIFIQHNKLRQHPVVERAARIARGEVRVIFTGPARRRAVLNGGRYRPLTIGASVGHRRITAGTLGCFCRSRQGGGIGFLSNNHVLANNNRARPGDIILQPGRADGGQHGNAADGVAALYQFVALDFSPGAVNRVDCAFAYLLADVGCDPDRFSDPHDAKRVWPIGAIDDLLLEQDFVHKVGRTTGYTKGSVTAVEVDNLVVQMAFGSGAKLARFDGQIAIEGREGHFSKGGDSGSIIFTKDGRPAALLFAGTETRSRGPYGITYANPIGLVLEQLDLDIYTGR